MNNMVTVISVDNIEVTLLTQQQTVIESLKNIGTLIPRFCYHKTLSIAGNCRMCLIQVLNGDKPVASCAIDLTTVSEIYTNTSLIKKARENVMEKLLINHPLDCPICDQAGECDLQDQSKTYGSSHSRYFFKKTSKENKQVSPLVKTIMTRCITCTRCARFAYEVTGKSFFGTLTRGKNTEIGSFISENKHKEETEDDDNFFFNSEFSSNVVDLCPVGALTAGPSAYSARPWELRLNESIDINDALGANIFVQHKENVIMRVLPKTNNTINDSIISDIARYSSEHSFNNRLSYDQTKDDMNKTTKLIDEAKTINFVVDEDCDSTILNDLFFFKNHFNKKIDISVSNKLKERQNNLAINSSSFSVNDIFSDSIENYFVVGANTRLENTLINHKIRDKCLKNDNNMIVFGFNFNTNTSHTLPYSNTTNIHKMIEGNTSENIAHKNSNIFLFGDSFLKQQENYSVFKNMLKNLNAINASLLKHSNSELINLFNLNSPKNKNFFNNVINCFINTDENTSIRKLLKKSKENTSFWLNANGSSSSNKADVVLPLKSHFEVEKTNFSLGFVPQVSQHSVTFETSAIDGKDVLKKIFNKKIKNNIEKLVNLMVLYSDKKQFINKELMNVLYNIKEVKNSFFQVKKFPIKEVIRNYYNFNKYNKNSNSLKEQAVLISKNYKLENLLLLEEK